MTNEELVRQYYDGDETALEKLYHKNIGLIRGIAKEAAADFNCLTVDKHHPNRFSAYTKTVLDDLCGEGTLELLTRIQSKEYDESRAVLTTYLYPHLKGRMARWLELVSPASNTPDSIADRSACLSLPSALLILK